MSIFSPHPLQSVVEPADLAHVDDDAIAALDDVEAAVLREHLRAEELRVAAARAKADYERISARRPGTKADIKAAKAAGDAARAHTDAASAEDADRRLAAAKTTLERLDFLISWKGAELAAADARAEEARRGAWAAHGELELRRARLLPPGKVDMDRFVKQRDRLVKEWETGRRRAIERSVEAEGQRRVWEHASRPPVVEPA